MRISLRPFQAAFGPADQATPPSQSNGLTAKLDDTGAALRTPPIESYVSVVFQVLAVFRFFSFAMGAGLIFVKSPGGQTLIVEGLLMAVVGLYNVGRVFWRFDPASHRVLFRWLTLGIDVVFSVALVLMTLGLDSAFLIYSFAPILTASLLMDLRSSLAVAAVSGLAVTGAYVVSGLGIGGFPWVLTGNYLALSLMYLAVCMMMAYLPFLSNLNWQQRIRNESRAAERQRLRREVHDNVAQTLAFLSLKVKRAGERASAGNDAITSNDVADIGSMVERAYLAVRDYLDESNDQELGEPLGTSLTSTALQWSQDTGLPVQMNLSEDDDSLSPGVKLQLLQIAREALANVAKHAAPTRVWIDLEYASGRAFLRIRDDGAGFSSSQPVGHGMGIMRERAGMIEAELAIQSEIGEGTEVSVIYPRGEGPSSTDA